MKPRSRFRVRRWLRSSESATNHQFTYRRWCDVFACDVYKAIDGKASHLEIDRRLDYLLPFVPAIRLVEDELEQLEVLLRDTSSLRSP